MAKLKIFLTGKQGFIGRNIFELLDKKYQFIAPSHDELELVDSDAVYKFMKKNPIDIVIHLANRGGNQKEANFEHVTSYNLRMFFNIVRNDQFFKKMILVGSGAEYGKQLSISKVKETDFDSRIPSDDFGLYKYICAKYIEKSENIVNLRIFGLYGKYENWQYRFISNTICKVIFNMPITINQNIFFDYLYVEDFTKILDHFLTHDGKFKTYNVGTGVPIDLVSIAQKILKISGKKLPIKIMKSGLNNEYTCDNQRLKDEIIGLKFSNFDEKLEYLYRWYQKNISKIDKNSLNLNRVEIWRR
ncbi:hypothetical protein A3D81_01210 [Candidatus Curtissbacteria bacterium RIFCSPHIGHO2_02_FULL_40_17]|uniref:NAD-dependent epimerase/dehydratase domain-containing protein n=4 Tax=Candidatus Curtissiibacteriota TaxID=1752717 RepID=A0A1F5GHR6_9BACT|nr:MAG: hypothetical protein A2693_02770 [Candidatus Curtissbacteria bacterium RIFCSPHIGHO2_01_FULL_40_12]OGD91400.1 MAG: hypothetical protein A3D81_01210 [Candidatus Curtissbacteria bacterium RIFCSPHIGHO2_02_FULL_40_17]OGE04056.1 MAG: hypothetical protein A3F45_02895 [Candidatus Curtissbacteria bacterium RIFCSPHIGHO2_12_FULL_41_17]OGE08609.1 MAG: hypothetical protein A3I53_02465 [Candidatus Curtissbacteria bacterium RIFCSPLOWO2_02_FULL_40_13b]